jgi:phage terminase small subunit
MEQVIVLLSAPIEGKIIKPQPFKSDSSTRRHRLGRRIAMGELANSRYERFAQELATGNTADGAYGAAGYRKHRGNAARLSANESIKDRVREIQAAGAERAAITVQSLIEEAEQARIKAMESSNGAAAAVSAITAKAKLAGLWREKVDQHTTGSIQYERIERVIVEHSPDNPAQSLSDDTVHNGTMTKTVSNRQPPSRPGTWTA